MENDPTLPGVEHDGWTLVSAEARAASAPGTFHIPARDIRESLNPGDGARLLFDIETRENGVVTDKGVDRMWVIVKSRANGRYIGVLDSNPGVAGNAKLHEGDLIAFGPEHICNIETPPRDYVLKKYGSLFFGT